MKNTATKFDVTSKETLAKLLATEDLTVIHKNTKTASFDLVKRVLTLPMWKDMDADTTDHLSGHEVGHALYTPEEGWVTTVEDKTHGFKTYLNVIEDARIEKLVMRRYPGLRRSFIKSYVKMLDSGFFGKSRTTINAYGLIDRLNVHFKCGNSSGVTFSKEEEVWVEEIKNAETWDEVVDIAERLYDKAKDEADGEEASTGYSDEFGDPSEESDNSSGWEDYDGNDEEESEESGDNGNMSDSKSEDEGSTPSSPANEDDEESDEDEDSSEAPTSSNEGGYDFHNDPTAVTDEILSENIVNEYVDNVEGRAINNLYLPTDTINKFVTSYKDVITAFDNTYSEDAGVVKNITTDMMKKFRLNNKPTINYLVKEFEMKKRASEYARTTIAKTGVIDPLKMNSYRFSDDIFKKISVVPEGKNHGLLMFVDFSGSMAEDMGATIDQTLNLIMFCRQVNISFRVYGFTNKSKPTPEKLTTIMSDRHKETRDRLMYTEDLNLIELFNNKMSRSDFIKMSEILLYAGTFYRERYTRRAYYADPTQDEPITAGLPHLPSVLWLYGTPLQDTICGAIEIFHDFKKANRLDIVNTVFLTDGESNQISVIVDGNERYYNIWPDQRLKNGSKAFIIDPYTKKSYLVEDRYNVTTTLLEIFRDNTKSNAIGYRIISPNKKRARNDIFHYVPDLIAFDNLWKGMSKEKFIMIPNSGYTEFFAIQGGKNLETANTSLEVADDAKKGAIRNAFKKANNNRKTSRVMLTKFIDLIA